MRLTYGSLFLLGTFVGALLMSFSTRALPADPPWVDEHFRYGILVGMQYRQCPQFIRGGYPASASVTVDDLVARRQPLVRQLSRGPFMPTSLVGCIELRDTVLRK